MEDQNEAFRGEVNRHLEYLLKKIGNNRQQLAAKVIGLYREVNKELSKEKVDQARKSEILREVTSMEKVAANQLPHYEAFDPSVAPAPAKKAEPKPEPKPKPAAKAEVKEAPKAKASGESKAAKSKTAAKPKAASPAKTKK